MADFTRAVWGGMPDGCIDGWGPSCEYRGALKTVKGLGEVL